ncbi:hypothetical protein DCAR_0310280 [Daucus carota subsp. sativus]|uniref:Uncharacterized protein n=1 Tax=Daucus carota subsp. sativus TaxID=79200 RepID=A0AAF0WK44_DAUCS|nr:PREDICTED: serine carboxypeptidase-like 13 [Daucus carota subsp. sativus]WOG91032.1 hypothetical protein DCAR_0310280 [Daucus carota subsp. sativus]
MQRVRLLIVLLAGLSCPTFSQKIVKALPGFPGELPFKLETGYVEVGGKEDLVLFYYFVQSERNASEDPLLIWISGGPGCSSFRAFMYQLGPLTIDYDDTTKEIPDLHLNPYSWTKFANIIFMDVPITGFSYSKSPETYKNSDTLSPKYTYEFLCKWLEKHPQFRSNPLYITGVSYSGLTIPAVVEEIFNGNEAGNEPRINIEGYVLGNPLTVKDIDFNARIPYAHRMSLLSDQIFESTKLSCKGDYINVNQSNTLCQNDLQQVNQCLKDVCFYHISEDVCNVETSTRSLLQSLDSSSSKYPDLPLRSAILKGRPLCREITYPYASIWADNVDVRKALHIRQGTIGVWARCNGDHYYLGRNDSDHYAYNVDSSLEHHRNLTRKSCRALILSGDHDLIFPYIGTKQWIQDLHLSVDSTWAPWFVRGQVAGYTESFSHNDFTLTFATVKGAGHAAQEYRPEECQAMAYRWLGHKPL